MKLTTLAILLVLLMTTLASALPNSEEIRFTPSSAHEEYANETAVTNSNAQIIRRGLGRGLANIVCSPIEAARAPYYEFSIRKWYWACATAIPASLGGMLVRIGAGTADLVTLGSYGDQPLAEGFPEYVWLEEWSWKPTSPRISTVIGDELIPFDLPEKDIQAESKRAKEIREATTEE